MKTARWIKRWQTLVVLSLVTLMAMVIVACGDDDEETPAATAAPTAAPAPAPTSGADDGSDSSASADSDSSARGHSRTGNGGTSAGPDSSTRTGDCGPDADEAEVYTCGNGYSGAYDRGGGDG